MPRPYEVEIEKMPRRIDKATRWSRKEERRSPSPKEKDGGDERGDCDARAKKVGGTVETFWIARCFFPIRVPISAVGLRSLFCSQPFRRCFSGFCDTPCLCWRTLFLPLSLSRIPCACCDRRRHERLRRFILSPGGFAHRIKSATSIKRGCLSHCRDSGISRAVPSFFSLILTKIGAAKLPKSAGRIAQNLWTDLRVTWG